MSIPIATTRITVLRETTAEEAGEAYEGDTTRIAVAKGVRANLNRPRRGTEIVRGSEQSVTLILFQSDPVDVNHTDWVKDETSGRVYQVVWVQCKSGLGLDHVAGELKIVEGLV